MAIFSALFSLLARKLGDIVQAIFGWSITALFGKLPTTKQVLLSVALVLSILWPLFVLGTIVPGAAAWALAFLPLEKWLGATVLRIVWIALAVVAPLIVGAITHYVAPDDKVKGGFFRTMINGYPLALGFFVSFIVTVVTVPVVKIASLARGWTDTHVFLQPKEGKYEKTVHDLAEACALTGIVPEIAMVPTSMALSTKAMKFFARGAMDAIVADDPKMLRAPGIEIYLYPADLLLRGKKPIVAHVRAMMAQTLLERDAYLVGTPKAQHIQDELGRMWKVAARHDRATEASPIAAGRLHEIRHEMNTADIEFEDWVMLDRILTRLERKFDTAKEEAATMLKEPQEGQEPLDESSTGDLIKEALVEAQNLVRLEVKLAKEDVKSEVKSVSRAAIGFGVAAASSLMMMTMLAVALVLAIGPSPWAALLVAGGFLVVCAVAGIVGYTQIPKNPLARTRERMESDVNHLKEHIA
jgi:hypothetical protein